MSKLSVVPQLGQVSRDARTMWSRLPEPRPFRLKWPKSQTVTSDDIPDLRPCGVPGDPPGRLPPVDLTVERVRAAMAVPETRQERATMALGQLLADTPETELGRALAALARVVPR